MGETKPKLGVSFLHSQDISMNNLCHCFPQGLLGAILWKRDFWDRARGQWTRRTSPPVPTAHFADTLEGIMETHRSKSQVVLISHQSDKIRGERWIFFLSISVYLSFDPLCCGLSHLYLVRDQLLLNRKEDEFLLFWCWALSNRDSVSAFPYNHFYDICKKRFYKVFARISQVIKMASRNSCDGWKERCLRGAPPPPPPYLLGEHILAVWNTCLEPVVVLLFWPLSTTQFLQQPLRVRPFLPFPSLPTSSVFAQVRLIM